MVNGINGKFNIPKKNSIMNTLNRTPFQKALVSLDSKKCLLKFWGGNILRPGKINMQTGKFLGPNERIQGLLDLAVRDENFPKIDAVEIKEVIERISSPTTSFSLSTKEKIIHVTSIQQQLRTKVPNLRIANIGPKIFDPIFKHNIANIPKNDLIYYYPTTFNNTMNGSQKNKLTEDIDNSIRFSEELTHLLLSNKIEEAAKFIDKHSSEAFAAITKIVEKDTKHEGAEGLKLLLVRIKDALSEIQRKDLPIRKSHIHPFLEGVVLLKLKRTFPKEFFSEERHHIITRIMDASDIANEQNQKDPILSEIHFYAGTIAKEENFEDPSKYFKRAFEASDVSFPNYNKINSAHNGLR